MKTTLTVLLSGLLLCGCSQKQATSASPAIDLVETSKAVAWSDGYVIYIGKRHGASLEDIHVSHKYSNGATASIFAEKGTVSAGSVEDPKDVNSVKIILENARIVSGMTMSVTNELTLVLHKAL